LDWDKLHFSDMEAANAKEQHTNWLVFGISRGELKIMPKHFT